MQRDLLFRFEFQGGNSDPIFIFAVLKGAWGYWDSWESTFLASPGADMGRGNLLLLGSLESLMLNSSLC